MLRIRPTLHTPHASQWADLLTALGLVEMKRLPSTAYPAGHGQRCFAADSGRLLLQESPDFSTELFLEVRDLEKFASWTSGDGTPVGLQSAEGGNGSPPLGRIIAPDGLTLTALSVDSLDTAGTPPEVISSDGHLAVLALWNTPDEPGARATLANIGAKPDIISKNGSFAQYRAKHGGFVAAHVGDEPRVDLTLEYTGNLEALANRLSRAGLAQRLVNGAYGRTLLVDHPDGGGLWINERQLDLYGYVRR